MSEDAGIEPRPIATSALAVRRSNHSALSHPLILIEYRDTWAAIQRRGSILATLPFCADLLIYEINYCFFLIRIYMQ